MHQDESGAKEKVGYFLKSTGKGSFDPAKICHLLPFYKFFLPAQENREDGGIMSNTENIESLSSQRALLDKQAALEVGFKEMEQGLAALGVRIEDCRFQMSAPSEFADMAVNASRLERRFLSLRKKLKTPPETPIDPETRQTIRELATKNRQQHFYTRALKRETRRNSKILNSLAEKLKGELNKRRAEDLRVAREKAAKVRLQQNPPQVAAKPKLNLVKEKSADILPFPARVRK